MSYEQLEERIAKLERQMESMAEVVAAAAYCTFGKEFDGTSFAYLKWEEHLIPGSELDSNQDEICGWWTYTVRETANA